MDVGATLEKRIREAQSKVDTNGVRKVLNVSKVGADGSGTVIAVRPKTQGAEAKGKVKFIEGLDIISDNYDTYAFVAEAVGRPDMDKKYYNLYVRAGGVKTPSGPKSPKKVPKTFEEKLAKAVENAERANPPKLVNVSALHISTSPKGKEKLIGFRTVDAFDDKGKEIYGKGYSGDLRHIGGLPLISNNYDSYATAAKALGENDFAAEFAKRYGAGYDKRGARKSPSGGAKKSPGLKRDATAADRLHAMLLKARESGGKLDVSNLDFATGTKSRVIHPKTDREVNKVGVAGIEVVSNTYEKFAEAMELLEEADPVGDYLGYAREYEMAHGGGPGKRIVSPKGQGKAKPAKRTPRVAVPKARSRSLSPGRTSPTRSLSQERRLSQERTRLSQERARSTSAERAERASRLRSLSAGRRTLPIPQNFDEEI
jgi:hypothetical protein